METGTRVGPYEIIRELGRGGMGVVYLGRDTRLNRDVALKAIPEHLAHDAERLSRFEREAQTLAQLNHANVAGIYGVEEHAGATYLVLEFVDGETLAARLGRGALPVDEALELGVQIAAGVEAAHEAGVIHRDLKPGNVIVRPDGTAKVLDFGLARMEADGATSTVGTSPDSPTLTRQPVEHSPTLPGVIIGTAAYMSPEQARGRRADKRTDIWSFGVIMYECLTGSMLFGGESAADSMGAIMHRDPDWTALPPRTPATIRLLLRRCLTRDVARRLRDIGDARIELSGALADPVASSLGLDSVADVSQPHRGRGVALMVVALVLAGILGVLLGRGLTPQNDLAVRKFEIPLQGRRTWNIGQPAISPDGTMVALVDQERIWIRHLNEWESRAVEGSERGIIPFWSPDSRWLGFGREKQLFKVPVSGGRPVLIAEAVGTFEMIAGAAWSADGRIFFSTGDAGIFVVSADGGIPETYVAADEPDDDDFHELALLPDGKSVIFTVHSRGQPWYLGLFDGRQRRVIFSFGGHFAVTPAYSPSGHLLVQRFGNGSSTWAIPFDAARLEVTGEPFLIADGDSDPSVSDTGTLVLTRSIADYFGGELASIDLDSLAMEPFAGLSGVFSDPALSPDGASLAVSGFDINQLDIWIVNVEDGSRTRMTFDEARNEVLARWSPDGSEIAYAATTASAFERMAAEDHIHFATVNGGRETRAPIAGAYPSFDAAWKYLAFVRTSASTGRDIYFMPLDGTGEAQELLGQPWAEEHPAISPDGKWLAYTSNEAGAQAVYLTRFPSGQGKWQVSTEDGAFPRWSPDSTHIYYAGPEVGVYAVRLTPEPRVMLAPPQRVIDGPTLGVDPFIGIEFSADGKEILTMRSSGSERPATVGVIEHWFEEFRDRR